MCMLFLFCDWTLEFCVLATCRFAVIHLESTGYKYFKYVWNMSVEKKSNLRNSLLLEKVGKHFWS